MKLTLAPRPEQYVKLVYITIKPNLLQDYSIAVVLIQEEKTWKLVRFYN